jgi:hypothetical protein
MWIFAGNLADAVAALPHSNTISIEAISGLDWAKLVRQNFIAA